MLQDFSPSPESPVLVIGATSIDIIGRLKGDLVVGTSNPAQIRTSHGGVARNVAENLARLGQPVNLLTVVGNDQNGNQLLEQAMQAGINVDAVARTSKHPTGAYLGVLNAAGELQLAMDDMRALALLTTEYIHDHEELFEDSSAVFVDANLPKDTLRTVVSLARKARTPICADPTSVSLAPKLRPYLKRLKMITPNSAEAAILTEQAVSASRRKEALQAAENLVNQGVEIAVVALAEFGVIYATSETRGRVPAIRTTIVDPTGAGDAMTAAILYALLNNIPIDDAVRLGVSAASLTLGHNGAVVPDLSLEKLYDHLSL